MPCLHLQLKPRAEGGNLCDVEIPHEIRSQVFRYKKSSVRYVADENPASDQDADGENIEIQEPYCFVELPFFTGFEITSNIAASGLLPVKLGLPQDRALADANRPHRADVDSAYHINLKAEQIPTKFEVKVFSNDGITPKKFTKKSLGGQTTAENNQLVQIDLFFEYESNNLFH